MVVKHFPFLSRTVLVKNNSSEQAMRLVDKILGQEKIFEQYRRTRYYEKPTQTRRRINYEKCKAIYDEDMKRRISFLLRTNRENPYLGND